MILDLIRGAGSLASGKCEFHTFFRAVVEFKSNHAHARARTGLNIARAARRGSSSGYCNKISAAAEEEEARTHGCGYPLLLLLLLLLLLQCCARLHRPAAASPSRYGAGVRRTSSTRNSPRRASRA